MAEEAFKWWNGIVNDEEDNPNPPDILPPDDASLLVPLFSPILHNHTNYTIDADNCWKHIHETLCKLVDNPNVENPNDDFPEFVVQLYSYRKYLKIKDIDMAMIYIDKFCPDPPNDFFLQTMALSIDDPELSVVVLLKLFDDGDERFIKCLESPGFSDRLFDLYVPFLLLFNLRDQHFLFRLNVAELIIRVLEKYPGNLMDQMLNSLYQKLLALIVYAPVQYSYAFFRCLVKLNDFSLEKLSRDQQQNRLNGLLAIADGDCAIRFAILRYLTRFPNIIDLYEIIKYSSKHLPLCNTDLEILIDLVAETHNDSPLTHLMVVRSLCRTLMQSFLFMRSAATLLIEFLSDYSSDEIIDWMKAFIRRVFIFIRFCILKNKYLRRVLLLCSVLSSPMFKSIPWLYKFIQIYASEAYCQHLPFIADYFSIINEKDEIFEKEFSIFSSSKIQLKVFPFKDKTCTLSENHQTRQYTTYKSAQTDSRLEELNIPLLIARYLYYDTEISTSDQKFCQFQIEDLIQEQKDKYVECEKAHLSTKYPRLNKFLTAGKINLLGATIAYKESENAIWEFQKRVINDYLGVLNEIHRLLCQHPNIMANIKILIFDNNTAITDSAKYKNLKERKHACKLALYNMATKFQPPNYEQLIIGELANNMFKYDMSIKYSAPSVLDYYVQEYLNRNPKFAPMLDAAATIINMGVVEAAKTTIDELANAVTEQIGRVMDGSSVIISQSILRVIFDICYSSSSILNSYKAANAEFLRRCNQFIAKSISEAGIPDCIVGGMRKRATVQTLFRNKKMNTFGLIEYMTNPLDMVKHIYNVIQSLDSLNYNCTLHQEMVILVQCVISVSPPSNAVSAMKFINQWAPTFCSQLLNDSLKLYREAMDRIIVVDKITEE